MKKLGVLIVLLYVLPVPKKAFSTIWEYPTEQCHKNYAKTYIDFEKYNITTNANFTFDGDKIVIFYEDTFGFYPYYENYSRDHPVNGGLPQKCDLNAHLKKAREDIKKRIPNEKFSGLAIIDFERWRPLFSENDWMKKRVFQYESIRLYSGTPNGTNISEIEYRKHYNKAEMKFNYLVKRFFLETINLGKRMRTRAKWGFYGFPYCNYNAGNGTYGCHDKWKKWNNEYVLRWPLYFKQAKRCFLQYTWATAPKNKSHYSVFAMYRLEIGLLRRGRILDHLISTSSLSAVVKHDLCAGIAQPVFLGVDGLILWSSSNNMRDRCTGIKDQVIKRVGPLINKLTEARDRCSKDLCNSTGRCIRRKFKNQWYPMPKEKAWMYKYNVDNYACECNKYYKFKDCIKVENGPPKI